MQHTGNGSADIGRAIQAEFHSECQAVKRYVPEEVAVVV